MLEAHSIPDFDVSTPSIGLIHVNKATSDRHCGEHRRSAGAGDSAYIYRQRMAEKACIDGKAKVEHPLGEILGQMRLEESKKLCKLGK